MNQTKTMTKRKDANSIPAFADAVPTTFPKLAYPQWAQPEPAIGLRVIYNPTTKQFTSARFGALPVTATAHIRVGVNLYLEGYLCLDRGSLQQIIAKATGAAPVGLKPAQRIMFYISDVFGSAKQTQRVNTLWAIPTSYTPNYTSKVFTMMIGTVEDALRFRQNWYAGNFPTILFKSPDRLWAQPYSTVSVNSPHPHGRKGK